MFFVGTQAIAAAEPSVSATAARQVGVKQTPVGNLLAIHQRQQRPLRHHPSDRHDRAGQHAVRRTGRCLLRLALKQTAVTWLAAGSLCEELTRMTGDRP